MVDGHFANPRLIPGKAMACVMGFSRMGYCDCTFADLYTKKRSRPETSFELLKLHRERHCAGFRGMLGSSEEKAKH
jgi:hypothetical protein